MSDASKQLQEVVKHAYEHGRPLKIHGNQTKRFLMYEADGESILTHDHNGVLEYEPTELVITARAGTTIQTINETLATNNQMLAFDPPQFDGQATLGGIVATGLSGPARPWTGAARDFVLGCRIINGKGEILTFGGQVMKNVAGYDVSRLMVGAYGALGLILEVSCKVLPRPEMERTLVHEIDAQTAIEKINAWSAKPLPISGACWIDGYLYIRLSGTPGGVANAATQIGGDDSNNASFWESVRDFKHPFFANGTPVWRISVAPATPMMKISGKWMIDWGGAQRWLISDEPADSVASETIASGGHYGLWHDNDQSYLKTPLSDSLMNYHHEIKKAFDPQRIMNPGVFYPTL